MGYTYSILFYIILYYSIIWIHIKISNQIKQSHLSYSDVRRCIGFIFHFKADVAGAVGRARALWTLRLFIFALRLSSTCKSGLCFCEPRGWSDLAALDDRLLKRLCAAETSWHATSINLDRANHKTVVEMLFYDTLFHWCRIVRTDILRIENYRHIDNSLQHVWTAEQKTTTSYWNVRRAVCTDLGWLADYATSMQRRSNISFCFYKGLRTNTRLAT